MIFNPCAYLPLKQKNKLRLLLILNNLLTVSLADISLNTGVPENLNLIYTAQ
jgi:hypothetical protein